MNINDNDVDRCELAIILHDLLKDGEENLEVRRRAYEEFKEYKAVLKKEGIDFSTFLMGCREQ